MWDKIKNYAILFGGFVVAVLFAMLRAERARTVKEELKNADLKDKETHDKHVAEVAKKSDQQLADDLNKRTDS